MCLTEHLLKLGLPDNANQSADRTETKDSNILKSSKLHVHVSCKTMKSQRVCCDPYATSCYFILDFTFIIVINSRDWCFPLQLCGHTNYHFYSKLLIKRICRIIDFQLTLLYKINSAPGVCPCFYFYTTFGCHLCNRPWKSLRSSWKNECVHHLSSYSTFQSSLSR